MKNLENFGVQELDAREITETDGGIFGFDDVLVGVAIAVAAEIISDWDHFKAGFCSF